MLRSLKQANVLSDIKKEAKELLDFYVKKYCKVNPSVSTGEVGNTAYIDDFFKIIHENPFLIKAFGGKDALRSFISYEYDDLPF